MIVWIPICRIGNELGTQDITLHRFISMLLLNGVIERQQQCRNVRWRLNNANIYNIYLTIQYRSSISSVLQLIETVKEIAKNGIICTRRNWRRLIMEYIYFLLLLL